MIGSYNFFGRSGGSEASGIMGVGDKISKTIVDRKIPSPNDIEKVIGQQGVEPYFFMHALLHAIEYGRMRVIDYTRRDRKAIQRHSFDSAIKPQFRYGDRELSSGYKLNPREQIDALLHDLGEEFGGDFVGAIVVNHIISHLFGDDVGRDVSLLTNYSALLIDPHHTEILETIDRIEPRRVREFLAEKHKQVQVTESDIYSHSNRVLEALRKFRGYTASAMYLTTQERGIISGMMDDLARRVEFHISKRNLPSAIEAGKEVLGEYEGVIAVIDNKGSYIDIDERLLMPEDREAKFLVQLKRTLYRDRFIRNITGKALNDALLARANSSNSGDDGYLAPVMAKFSETTDTVANMIYDPMPNIVNVQRKARILGEEGANLVVAFRQDNAGDYQRPLEADEYMVGTLKGSIRDIKKHIQAANKRESTLREDLERAQVIEGKICDLEMIVARAKGPGFFGAFLRPVAKRLSILL